jgi:hypothetical protein
LVFYESLIGDRHLQRIEGRAGALQFLMARARFTSITGEPMSANSKHVVKAQTLLF